MKRVLATLAAILFAANSYASNRLVVSYGPTNPIPAAGTVILTDPFIGVGADELTYISMQVFFDVTTAGGTSINAYLQTTVDDGLIWQDVCDLQILAADVTKMGASSIYTAVVVRTAASDGALAADTCASALFGTKWRMKLVIVGAYNADNIYRLHVDWQKLR